MIKIKHYSTAFQKAVKWKCLLPIVLFVITLECLQTNLVFNGWWNLTQNIIQNKNEEKLAGRVFTAHSINNKYSKT
jgi:hypothetical protein